MSEPQISLLWPDPASRQTTELHNQSIADLSLNSLISALNVDGRHDKTIRSILLELSTDPTVIKYRQDIMQDMLTIAELPSQFSEFLPQLGSFVFFNSDTDPRDTLFQRTLYRLNELELYIVTVRKLETILGNLPLTSKGLQQLRQVLVSQIQDPIFSRLEQELPKIASKIRGLASVTIGVNLNTNLKPIAATLVSINDQPFTGSSMLNNLFGGKARDFAGITPLHTMPKKAVVGLGGMSVEVENFDDPLLQPLFRDLDRVIVDIVRPIEKALRDFLNVKTGFLAALEPEIIFYLGAVNLIKRLRANGLSLCLAEIASPEERICAITDSYNLGLALRLSDRNRTANLTDAVITNDVNFAQDSRIFILTGPNRGGKTTYTQGIGIAQVLFQAGLPVPGTSARMSPVDAIYTHFPIEEKPSAEAGRFGEEAARLNDIFKMATCNSLILLNESLSSTAAGESLYLARDIVRALRVLGVRAVFATHLHELAAGVDELNNSVPGDSKIISLVATIAPSPDSDIKRTFKIVAGPPVGLSYAREIALQYGISYDQLLDLLKTRNAI